MQGILTAKISEKKTLQDFRENSKYIYIFCFVFPIYKRARYKMDLISAKGYENAGVNLLKVEGTDEFRVSMKDVGVGLGVKSISDLVLKEIQGTYEKKKLTKEETKCYKMTEREFFKTFYDFDEDDLNTKSNKNVFVKNTIMANIIKHCRGGKKEV